jgi:hypothetical protein
LLHIPLFPIQNHYIIFWFEIETAHNLESHRDSITHLQQEQPEFFMSLLHYLVNNNIPTPSVLLGFDKNCNQNLDRAIEGFDRVDFWKKN